MECLDLIGVRGASYRRMWYCCRHSHVDSLVLRAFFIGSLMGNRGSAEKCSVIVWRFGNRQAEPFFAYPNALNRFRG
ncbi:MAG: hypothetical protein LKI80_15000 [Sporolactobacillus sp.]|nr:hypothetical protein [Sporolactobacillus sp.]